MRYILSLLLIISSYANAQTWQPTSIRQRFVNGIGIPTRDTVSGTLADSSQLVLRPQDSVIYFKYKGSWRKVGSAATTSIPWDSVSGKPLNFPTTYALSNDVRDSIQARLRKTDTAAMLAPYLRKIDTTNAFLISVSQPNDTTLTFLKGNTYSSYVLRGGTASAATKLITSVYNNSGSTILKGSVVYINGAHSSNLPTIALAIASQELTSAYTYGLVESDIPNNNAGIVVQNGNLTGLNLPTSIYTDGQTLYLSPTVPGGYSLIKPTAPNHYTAIGTITRAHPVNGTIQVAIRNGFQLDELSDVQIPAVPNDSALLQFSRVDSLWHQVNPTTAMGNRFIKPSDTAAMLSPYYRTSTATEALATKLNISDTSTMLSKYLRKTDTAALSIRIDQRVKYTDTTAMLNPYLRANVASATYEPKITAGTTAQYWRGDKTFQTLNTTAVPEGTNLYYTDIRARSAITLTTTGTSGAATYNNLTGVLNVPQYPGTNGTVTSIATTAPLTGGTITTSGTLGITQATTSTNGYLSSTDWNTFNNKQSALTNPITGTGTTNYHPKFTGSTTLGNSIIQDNGLVVGLGTTPSAWGTYNALQIGGSGYSFFAGSGATVFGNLFLNAYYDGANSRYINNGYSTYYGQANGEHSWATSSYGTVGNIVTHNTKMTLDNSGRLGIGTTSPSTTLDVTGTGKFSSLLSLNGGNIDGTLSDVLSIGNGAYPLPRHKFKSSTSSVIGGNILALNIATGNSTDVEVIRFTGNGNVGIGTTSPNGGLSIVAPSSATALSLWGRSTDNYSALRFQSNTGATTYSTIYTNAADLITEVGGSERMRITSTGNVLIGITTDDGANKLQVNGSAKITSLAGTGERNVAVDANGKLIVSTTAATVASGTYTPTASFPTNATSIGIYTSPYTQIGNVVTVTVSGYFTPTAANTFTKFNLNIPVAAISVGSAILYGTANISNGGATVNLAARVTATGGSVLGFVVESYPTFSGAVAYFSANIQYTLQ